jgi:hypothetical protein
MEICQISLAKQARLSLTVGSRDFDGDCTRRGIQFESVWIWKLVSLQPWSLSAPPQEVSPVSCLPANQSLALIEAKHMIHVVMLHHVPDRVIIRRGASA